MISNTIQVKAGINVSLYLVWNSPKNTNTDCGKLSCRIKFPLHEVLL